MVLTLIQTPTTQCYELVSHRTTFMTPKQRSERLRVDWVHSRHLENNKLGDPADKQVTVWLPPSYHRSRTQHYPVAYLLHGFGQCAWDFASDFSMSTMPEARSVLDSVDRFMKRKKCAEMILAIPDGTNKWGCSQWVDSGINGNYARYVADDMVKYVDANYRTIPDRRHRMVAGVSSGGIGAFHVAGGNPDVFGAVGIRSADIYFQVTHVPWLIDLVNASHPKGLRGPIKGNGLSYFCYANASAYAPNPRKKPVYGDLPITFPNGEIIDDVWRKWLRLDPIIAYKRYLDAFRSMHVYMDCGSKDEFHFHLGHRILHQRFKSARLRHVYEEFDGMHANQNQQRRLRTLEWFTGVLPGVKRAGGRV